MYVSFFCVSQEVITMQSKAQNIRKRINITESHLEMLYDLFVSSHKEGRFLSQVCIKAIEELHKNRDEEQITITLNTKDIPIK